MQKIIQSKIMRGKNRIKSLKKKNIQMRNWRIYVKKIMQQKINFVLMKMKKKLVTSTTLNMQKIIKSKTLKKRLQGDLQNKIIQQYT